jgi:hypothetical protein
MKRKILILFAIFLIAAVAILSSSRPVPTSRVEMGFLGFTNSTVNAWPIAMFPISNRPNLAVKFYSFQRVNPDPNFTQQSARWEWGRATEWGILQAIAVTTTNEPLAMVFQFQERASGLRRIPEQLRELWGKVTGNEREFFTGRKFLVTNETHVSAAPR